MASPAEDYFLYNRRSELPKYDEIFFYFHKAAIIIHIFMDKPPFLGYNRIY
ncbi:hypothetical protein PPOP_0257 [Paenibacillus popilliae ATCC 14706]|uniref:Uncharacterized protein n=1 Tax=Paenibacillus popilliae ATCC 14706 TaxID=1212764 RepID=M9L7I5_PAEPP|nr:hypothetical protein PPOP_0257 [Paenibacillus popilliae ATCC 14706]